MVSRLGKGGMGEVYRADDLRLGQPVALKFLPEKVTGDPGRLARFRHEVASARKVSHPHVCRVYDLGEHDGQPFLAMEYIDGEDLAALLRRIGRLPEDKGLELARQLCAALAAVHDQGLLHRDLKPANVMLDGRGRVRLTDFGLAALQDGAADVRSGTPAYMAPEQLAGKEVTQRSDLFALGLVLYEVFTGKKAFPAGGRDELMRLHAEATPNKPSSHVSGLDPTAESVILKCLHKDPADRPGSAQEVLAELPGGDPVQAALAAGKTPSPEAVADAGGEGTIAPWLGVALLTGLIGGIVLIAALSDTTMVYGRVPLEHPEVLARQAQKFLEGLGHAEKATDYCYYYETDNEYFRHVVGERSLSQALEWSGIGQARSALFLLPAVAGPTVSQGIHKRQPPDHGGKPADDAARHGEHAA